MAVHHSLCLCVRRSKTRSVSSMVVQGVFTLRTLPGHRTSLICTCWNENDSMTNRYIFNLEMQLSSIPTPHVQNNATHRLVAASLLATCSTTLPLLMFLKTDIASEWDIPWRARPFTARTSSPAKKWCKRGDFWGNRPWASWAFAYSEILSELKF